VLSKSLGSQNPINLVKATVTALQQLRSPDEVAELRGLSIEQVLGLDTRKNGGTTDEGAEAPAGEEAAEEVTA
jgi:small subunit ribosomal protein S5